MKKLSQLLYFCLLLSSLSLISPASFAVTLEQVLADQYGAWLLPSDENEKRWLVIHNLATFEQDKVFHIQVLAKAKEAKPWQVKRLAPHMAVSSDALIKDIIKATKGKVHPDVYVGAYQKWLASEEKNVCRTSLLQCLDK